MIFYTLGQSCENIAEQNTAVTQLRNFVFGGMAGKKSSENPERMAAHHEAIKAYLIDYMYQNQKKDPHPRPL